jgi:hypothetical protein
MRYLKIIVAMLALFPVLLASSACSHVPEKAQLIMNIQVTGADNFKPMLDELNSRNVISTVWLNAEEMLENTQYLAEVAEQGHEIAGKFDGQITEETSYAEQKEVLLAILEAAPGFTANQIAGFRATRFTANEYTYQLLDELKLTYLERSARDELFSVFTFKPYMFEGHDFAILPMPIRCAFGESGSLCDTSARGKLTADQFTQYIYATIDNNIKLSEPLILEWHPAVTYPGDSEGWWQAFIDILDYLETLDADVEYVTAIELVDRYAGE